MLAIVSFFWVDPSRAKMRRVGLTPEDVKAWDRMIARHLTLPHKRICVTHRPDLVDFMATYPLDMAKHVPGTCTVKLQAHDPAFAKAIGADRIVLMDIDAVAVGNLDPLFDHADDVRLWMNPNFEQGGKRGFYQGSMQYFRAGATEQLWSDFDPRETPSWLNRRFGGAEQCWISERLNTSYPDPGWDWDIPYWTETDGVYGAGRLFGGKMGNGVQSDLPENARIVFFPGDRSPSEATTQAAHPWIVQHYN